MDLSPETLLKNRYRIERKLGQGGMGAVFLAVDTALDNQVAVKSNRSPMANSASQFLREARLLASLHHPHLPRVIDYFSIDDMQYLVMDYIPGRDLETLIQEEGRQPLDRVLAWANQLGDALSFLHHQNPQIIHRDVKPANVRLSEEGEVILVDFGIAKVVDPNQATTASASGYTPGYAPPEQYGGSVRTGAYTDQFSLAALVYHLLSAEKPADAVERALGKAELIPLDHFLPGVPAYIQAALERALELRPSDRFPDIDDFMLALNNKLPQAAQKSASSDATLLVPSSAAPTVLVSPLASASTSAQTQQGYAAASRQGAVLPEAVPPAYPPYPPDQHPAAPARRISPVVIVVLVLGCLGLAAGAAIIATMIAPRLLHPAPTAALVVASSTPQPVVVVPTLSASNTLPPTSTPQLASAKPTVESSPTIAPTGTDTPVPSATPLSIGGGGLVAFSSNRGDGQTFQLWTMRVFLNDQGQAIAGDIQQLTTSEGNKRQPAWSPDGQKIAYVAPGAKGNDIWVMNADVSGEPLEITKLNGNESQPAWSPDGKWIAFTSDGRSDKVLMLYLVHPDGSGLMRLSYDQEESDPTWSPKMQLGFVMKIAGNRTLYIRGQRDPKTGATPTQPYYVTPVFFDMQALTGNLGQVSEPAWSPDGNWVAYTRIRSKNTLIYLAHYPVRLPVEKDIIPLTDSNKDSDPAWSPDGQWIVFTSARDGNSELYIMRSTGKSQNNLTNDPADDRDPAWWIQK